MTGILIFLCAVTAMFGYFTYLVVKDPANLFRNQRDRRRAMADANRSARTAGIAARTAAIAARDAAQNAAASPDPE